MPSPDAIEFAELRRTIAVRGTVRLVLGPASVALWAVVAMSARYGDPRVQILLPLLVLAAGFEGVRALHIGVERIGRYLQVFHEGERRVLPRWESAAMAPAPRQPGLALSPLFSPLFALACLANAVLSWDPLAPALVAAWAGLHAAFLVRVGMATRACRRQRAADLAHYQSLRRTLID
ncbi:MAG: hypothetical protein AB7I25_14520 [Vicinamibacterales bacterium]